MIISENFFKDIPTDKKETVVRKLKSFENSIKECHNINDIQKGFWILKVKGTNILKFRVNNGDRILFYIEDKEQESKVVFLRFCNHDEQIRVAKEFHKNISNISSTEFDLDCSEYIEDEIDEQIDGNLKNFYSHYNNVNLDQISSLVVEDEYIALLLDENNEDFLYYLSEEQFKSIKIFDKPIILSGCAGSGKSMVAIRKLLLHDNSEQRAGYISYNPLLVKKAKEYFDKFKKENQKAEFYSINDFILDYLHIEHDKLVLYSDFEQWTQKNKNVSALIKGYSIEQAWSEIFGVIKGYRGVHWERKTEKMLKLDEYLEVKQSSIDSSKKRNIYKVFEIYQKWLDKEQLYDENDIALSCINKISSEKNFKFDFLAIDEIQDMSETQIMLCYLMTKDPYSIMITGDMNQIVHPNYFSFSHIKDLIYSYAKTDIEETYLVKNYRNVSGIVNMINELTNLRKKLIGSSKYDQAEDYIRVGKKPIVTPCSNEDIKKLVNRIDNTDYSILVVGNGHTKAQINKMGCPIGRVFTVDEIKGLEYQNVICYNLISDMSHEWDTILSGNAYGDDYYRIFFNKLYVACTRARDTLCLVENDNANILLDKLEDYFTALDKFSIEVFDFTRIATANDWLEEAEKLETAQRYQQAIHAYEKAGCEEGAIRCKQLHYLREKKSNNHQKSFAVRIDTEDKRPLNGNIINMALNKVCKQYKVALDNYAQIIIPYNKENLGMQYINFSAEDNEDINIKISRFIEKEYKSDKKLNQRKVTIHVCLMVSEGIDQGEYYETNQFDTIIASYKNLNINIITRTTQSAEQKEFIRSYANIENLGQLGLDFAKAYSNEDFKKAMDIISAHAEGNFSEIGIVKIEAIISKSKMSNKLRSKLYSAISQSCFNSVENLDEGYNKMLEYAKKAIEYNPEDFDAYNNAGVALLNIGEPEEAKNYFERSLALNENFKLASQNLIFANKTIQEKKEKGYAKKTLNVNDVENVSKEFVNLYSQNKFDEAILFLYDILDHFFMNDNMMSILYKYISLCYAGMKDIDNALKYINLALEKDPSDEEIDKILDLLNSKIN